VLLKHLWLASSAYLVYQSRSFEENKNIYITYTYVIYICYMLYVIYICFDFREQSVAQLVACRPWEPKAEGHSLSLKKQLPCIALQVAKADRAGAKRSSRHGSWEGLARCSRSRRPHTLALLHLPSVGGSGTSPACGKMELQTGWHDPQPQHCRAVICT